jgi:hypothetical protein
VPAHPCGYYTPRGASTDDENVVCHEPSVRDQATHAGRAVPYRGHAGS